LQRGDAAIVSHDLRNRAHVVVTAAALLGKKLGAAAAKQVESILRAGPANEPLIDDLPRRGENRGGQAGDRAETCTAGTLVADAVARTSCRQRAPHRADRRDSEDARRPHAADADRVAQVSPT